MNTSHNQHGSNIPVLRDEIGGGQLAVHDPYANAYIPEDEIDFKDIWKIITKHKDRALLTGHRQFHPLIQGY